MTLSNLNALDAQDYFSQLYSIFKLRENSHLMNGSTNQVYRGIHSGGAAADGTGGDRMPTIGYGWNMAARTATEVSDGLLYAYGGAARRSGNQV